MGEPAVFCSILCFTVLALTCSGSSSWTRSNRQTSEITPPPVGGCALPQPPEFGSYTSPVCQPNDKSPLCKHVPGTPVPQNWLVKFQCNAQGENSSYVFCVNGIWTPSIPDCRICGKKAFNTVTLSGSGESEPVIPWFAGIYKNNSANQLEQICGGTLISPHIVVTAAHCVYLDRTKQAVAPSEIKVALGKRFREWTRDEPGAVRASVRTIAIPPLYRGQATLYAHDMALLDLVLSAEITPNLMPACVDWNRQFTTPPELLGTLAGWGLTENGTHADILRYVQLPYLDTRRCLSEAPAMFVHYITYDKFCSESTSGAKVTPGYAGGGLTFERNGSHYVQGVLSTKVKGDGSLVTFTDIVNVELLNWLQETKSSFEKQHTET